MPPRIFLRRLQTSRCRLLSLRSVASKDLPAWESLSIVKLATAVEAEFGVTITPDDAVDFTSVQAIVDLLREKNVR